MWLTLLMTIGSQENLTRPGYRIRHFVQLGCASTGDEPSEEATASARTYQDRRLKELDGPVGAAVDFFRRGAHPFTRFRGFLADSGAESDVAGWREASVSLFVKPETPDIVRRKLAVEFILAQAFAKELPDFVHPDDPRSGPDVVAVGHYRLQKLLLHARRYPDVVRRWAADPGERAFGIRVLLRVLDRAPYGVELLEEARGLHHPLSLGDLLMFSSDVQAPELKAVNELWQAQDAKAWYAPLT